MLSIMLHVIIIQMAKPFLCLNLQCGLVTIVSSEVHCIIRLSQSISCDDSAECGDSDSELTLSQFINNSSNYLTDNTTLIFSPGNYSLDQSLLLKMFTHSLCLCGLVLHQRL